MKKIIIPIIFVLYFLPSKAISEIKTIIEGKIDSKIKMIVYESLTCSHCANFHKNVYPSIKEDFIDKGYAHIEFRNFPLDLMAFNASKIAHCRNDGKSEILHYLYNNQEKWIKGNTIEEANENIKLLI